MGERTLRKIWEEQLWSAAQGFFSCKQQQVNNYKQNGGNRGCGYLKQQVTGIGKIPELHREKYGMVQQQQEAAEDEEGQPAHIFHTR